MERNLTSKWGLIVFIVAMCIWSLYPPQDKLKLGPDLAGGTSFLYEVDTSGAENQQQVIERTIETLKRRVDPQGVRNLGWRQESGNRIEILMPQPSAEVREQRSIYDAKFEVIAAGNITRAAVLAALKAEGDARQSSLDSLVNGVESRKELFVQLTRIDDELKASRGAYDSVQAELDEAKAALEAAKAERAKQEASQNIPLPPVKPATTPEPAPAPVPSDNSPATEPEAPAQPVAPTQEQSSGKSVDLLKLGAQVLTGEKDVKEAVDTVTDKDVTSVNIGGEVEVKTTEPVPAESDDSSEPATTDEPQSQPEAPQPEAEESSDAFDPNSSSVAVFCQDDAATDDTVVEIDPSGTDATAGSFVTEPIIPIAPAEPEALAEEKKVEQLQARLIETAGKVAKAERDFDSVLDQVIETNIDPAALGMILELSTQRKLDDNKQEIVGSSPREVQLDKLYESHKNQVDQLKELVAAYDAYFGNKRPLDDPADLMRLLEGSGVLEFRIAMNESEVPDLADRRKRLAEQGPSSTATDSMQWFKLDDIEKFADSPKEVVAMTEDPVGYLASRYNLIGAEYGGEYYVLLSNEPGKRLSRLEPNWELSKVYQTVDDKYFPAVGFELNAVGGGLMGELTGNNTQRQMAIVLDDNVYSAPTIQSRISDRGIITGGKGGFARDELEYLIRTLDAGSLDARLSDPISVRTVGPNIGADNLSRGLSSALAALIIVAIFMMGYYFFAGFVADLALAANIVIILGIMGMLDASFTLPGIAGIVLTIGMCVDANVLVFERIREEMERGAQIATAVRLGYQKALSSILDGNITNMIVCVVLGYTASAEVKGFAITLGVGICSTLFASLFVTRVIFQTMINTVGIKKLSMVPVTVPAVGQLLTPQVDWVGKRMLFWTVSGTLCVIGLVLCFSRGQDLLDIEFRSGTEVSFELKDDKTMKLADVRDRIRQATEWADDVDASSLSADDKIRYEALKPVIEELADRKDMATVNFGEFAQATVVTLGDVTGDYEAGSFSIVTPISDREAVAAVTKALFSDVIDVQDSLRFKGAAKDDEDQSLGAAPVYPITKAALGDVISDASVSDTVENYVGGVAIVLDEIQPAVELEVIRQRVKDMRLQPDFENLKYRSYDVVGVTPFPDDPSRYTKAVVVSKEEGISYFNDPTAWEQSLAKSEWNLVSAALARQTSLSKVSNFSPTVSRTIQQQAIVALVLSILAIIVYIWFRFGRLRYGFAAIVALVHDVTITMGLVAVAGMVYDNALGSMLLLAPFKINMGLIAALLTIIGYSLNDTIVVFDRIRENRGKSIETTAGVINRSINQVFSRTVLTSGTTLLAVFMMYTLGGEGIHGFAFALLVGAFVGTYSSIGIASPILLGAAHVETEDDSVPTKGQVSPA